uniref:Uncharacterized protein n=1 Tax=Timema genevievae TaxID=629358 RepID=A0A7R9PMR6_TIMGE|nr:unnamed protein product [Timema genevievae]
MISPLIGDIKLEDDQETVVDKDTIKENGVFHNHIRSGLYNKELRDSEALDVDETTLERQREEGHWGDQGSDEIMDSGVTYEHWM